MMGLAERLALWISFVVVAIAGVFLSIVGFHASRDGLHRLACGRR